jgi:hypothetical protein
MIVVILTGIVASLFAAMKAQKHRFIGFCGFFCTNICWIIYGVYHSDYNIILQFGCFIVISSIGIWSNKGFLFNQPERLVFEGNKFIPDGQGGDYYSGEYVFWLEEQVGIDG